MAWHEALQHLGGGGGLGGGGLGGGLSGGGGLQGGKAHLKNMSTSMRCVQ